ncbi:hypothetical protein [Streptomyces sp. CoH27]|nr:hypothetical protein [Streptomyces sp. CoH27]
MRIVREFRAFSGLLHHNVPQGKGSYDVTPGRSAAAARAVTAR